MVAAAYPTYMSGLEKARAQEAVRIISHLVSAQDKFQAECYAMTASGDCGYSTSFLNLPVDIKGPNSGNISVSAGAITTSAFEYAISENGETITATPRNNSYRYTLTAVVDASGGQINCNVSAGSDSGKKICSAIGKKSTDGVYIIE
jgi:Tfp pilus assembly protein PilE